MKQKTRSQTRPDAQMAILVTLVLSISAIAFVLLYLHGCALADASNEPTTPTHHSAAGASMAVGGAVGAAPILIKRSLLAKANGSDSSSPDRCQSPYFYVPGADAESAPLPLKSTRADVDISGVIASVVVTQVYHNTGDKTLEAIYVFPGSTRAAVHAMSMTIGERTIHANIKKKAEARADYNAAKQNGQTASLLEQHRPNVFQMSVANILPGDEIEVELFYTELLVPEDGLYEFAYPTVVGPRYSNTETGSPTGDSWIENPYLKEGEKATYTFGLDMTLNAGMPIAKIASPSHDLLVNYQDAETADITIADSTKEGNRDVVLRYRLQGNAIQTGLLLYPGEKENFFLMMMEPPERVETDAIPPREYVFIVDVSGSMHGFPLDVSKALISDLLSNLRNSDHFNILFFAGGNSVLSEKPLPATKANITKAMNMLTSMQGGGGTELLPAMQRALSLPKAEGVSRTLVIATDGYVSVEKKTFELIREKLGEANLFSFGIGSSVNRFLIEGMARAGLGEPFIVLNAEEAKTKAKRFREYIQSPVLTDIEVDFEGVDAYDVEPMALPDLFAKRPLILFGKYKGEPEGAIRITGYTPDGRFDQTLEIADAAADDSNTALRYLWARQKVMRLADMNKIDHDQDRIDEVTELGLTYSLLTDYTSFIAIDSERRGDGSMLTVKQPLPLPEGVSNYAVGGMMQAKAAAPMTTSVTRGRNGYGLGGIGFGGGAKAIAEEAEATDSLSDKDDEAKKDRKHALRGVVKIGNLAMSNGFDNSVAEIAIKKQINAIRRIYQKRLAQNPKLSGKLTLKITIGSNGRPAAVTIAKDAIGDQKLAREVVAIMQRLRIQAATAVITLTLDLNPAS